MDISEQKQQSIVRALHRMFENATENRQRSIDINARDLHTRVGGVVGDQLIYVCCEVMLREMHEYDQIINYPPTGSGPTLIVSYLLPRENINLLEGEARELLIERFHKSMVNVYEEIYRRTGYLMSKAIKRVRKQGGLAAAKYWLRPGSAPSKILETLNSQDLLDISFEYLVLEKSYNQLFTIQESLVASERLYAAMGANITGSVIDLITNNSVCNLVLSDFERNPKDRLVCLEHYGKSCSVCEINFETVYGHLGKDYMQVHHITPSTPISSTYVVDPVADLRPICPNCHAMLHRQNPPMEISKLKEWIATQSPK